MLPLGVSVGLTLAMATILLQDVGGSLGWNQYVHLVDAEVKFYKYRLPILFVEVFWKQH